jgi:hypothetical protein
MKYFEALKIWNVEHNKGTWCVPKKGTAEYDAIKAILAKHNPPKPEAPKKEPKAKPAKKVEEKKEVKNEIIAPAAEKKKAPRKSTVILEYDLKKVEGDETDKKILDLLLKKTEASHKWITTETRVDDYGSLIRSLNKERYSINKKDHDLDKIKQYDVPTEPVPRTKHYVRVPEKIKEEIIKRATKYIDATKHKVMDLAKEYSKLDREYNSMLVGERKDHKYVNTLNKQMPGWDKIKAPKETKQYIKEGLY